MNKKFTAGLITAVAAASLCAVSASAEDGCSDVLPYQGIGFAMPDKQVSEEIISLPLAATAEEYVPCEYASSFGYNSLTAEEQAVYDVVYARAVEIDTNTENSRYITTCSYTDGTVNDLYVFETDDPNEWTPIPSINLDSLRRVFYAIMYDNPQLFWVGHTYYYSYYSSAPDVAVAIALGTESPSYRYGTQRQTAKTKTYAEIERVLDGADDYLNEYSKEWYVHDYLCNKTIYDPNYRNSNKNPNSHDITGLFLDGVCVCESYARSFQLLMNACDVDVRFVTGKINSEGHAWNQIELGGSWYNVDVTGDDTDPGYYYGYFNVTADDFTDHSAWTNGDPFLYNEMTCTATTYSYANHSKNFKKKVVDITPKNLKATAGDSQLRLSWDKVDGAEKYRIQQYVSGSWTSVAYPTTNSYTVKNLKNGGKYVYRVLAYADGAWGEPSAKVLGIPVSSAPQNLTATAGNGQITLKWNAVSGAAKYRVQHYVSGSWSTVAYPTTNTCTIKGLTNGGKYVYRVLAYVNGAWGEPSAKVLAVPKGSVIPQNLTATAGDGQVTLKWNAVNGAVKYRLQHYVSGSWTTIAYPKTNSHTVTGLKNGGKYVYRVLAYVNGAWSGASAKVLAVPEKSAAPTGLCLSISSGKATIRWDEVSGAVKYRVQMKTADTSWSTIGYSDVNSYALTEVKNGVPCSYRVIAYVNSAWGTPSKAFSVTLSI